MTALVIAILSLVIAVLLYSLIHVSRSINEFSLYAKELESGNLGAQLFSDRRGRLYDSIRSIISTIEKIRTRLGRAEREHERMQAILKGMSDALLITDKRGIVVFANEAFRKLMPSESVPLEGKMIMEVVRALVLAELFKSTIDSEKIISEEITMPTDQKERYFIATSVPIYSGDFVSGAVISLHDITRLRQLEDIRKDFIANVSHEIKTPITALKGFAETLLDGALEEKDTAIKFLGMIKNHSERLNNLVNDLLTLSGIEFGDIVLDKTEIDGDKLIDTVFFTLQDKADRKGLLLKKEIATNIPLYADKDRLIQIMLNLVDNGIKFTEKGGVTVRIAQEGGHPVLSVIDTGIGIPQQHLERLGERFYRVDKTRSRALGGTGLGLAIVKHLVKAHGWDLRVESEPGKGTCIAVSTQ